MVRPAGRIPRGDPAPGPGDSGHGRQDESAGRAASGLPAPYRRAQGVPLRQGGALQHAAGRREFKGLTKQFYIAACIIK